MAKKAQAAGLWILLLIFSMPLQALESIGYVTDHLQLTLFKEKGTGDKVKTLESADVLDLLEESGQFYRVRTMTGEEGWVKKHYIVTKPPAKQQLLELEAGIRADKSKIKTLEKIVESKKVGESLRQDYETQLISANQENVQLFNDKLQLNKKLDQASLEVQHLKSELQKEDTVHPAIIPLAGVVAGMLVGIGIGWILHVRKISKRFYGFKL